MIWFVVALCASISFVFAGLEAGILSVNRVRLQHYARSGNQAAVKLERLLREPGQLLVTVLLVTNFLNILAIALSTRELVRAFGHWGYLISFLVWLPLYLFVMQLLPKALFRRFPFRALAAFSQLLWVSVAILSPLVNAGARLASVFYPRDRRPEQKVLIAREDVKYFMTESERVGTLTKLERAMILNIVDFRSIKARDVMTPIGQIETISSGESLESLFRICRSRNLDRLPVTGPDGRISGQVNVFDALVGDGSAGKKVEAFQRRIVVAAPDEPAYVLFRKLRTARAGLAVIVHAGEQPLGIVSASDLISRLVSVAAPEAVSGEA